MAIGIGIGISYGQRRRTFSPAALFANGEPGVWIDPLDPATLFTDTAGTTQAGIVDSVAAARLLNDDTLAVQPTLASRPILGRVPATGRRNLLTRTEEFDANWNSFRSSISPDATTPPSNVGILRADKLVEDTTAGNNHTINRIISSSLAVGDYTFSVFAKAAERDNLILRVISDPASASIRHSVNFNLLSGEIVSTRTDSEATGTSESITAVGNGWYRCSITMNHSTTTRFDVQLLLFNTNILPSNPTYDGDGVSGVFIAGASLTEAATPYQRVGSQFDVTEAGVSSLRYLGDPSAASLPATVPDLGTNATLAYATEAGVAILTGQTIGAGELEILRGDRTYGLIANNRPWTDAETAGVTAWLNARIPS